jgi:hypothetical protein
MQLEVAARWLAYAESDLAVAASVVAWAQDVLSTPPSV